MQNFEKFENAQNRWSELHEKSGEKLFWLAKFDGDLEKARWAFLNHHGNKKTNEKKGRQEKFVEMEPPANSTADWKKNINLIWLYSLGVIFPNIALKAFISVDPTFSNAIVTTYLLVQTAAISIFVWVGFKRYVEQSSNNIPKVVVILISLVSVVALVFGWFNAFLPGETNSSGWGSGSWK